MIKNALLYPVKQKVSKEDTVNEYSQIRDGMPKVWNKA